MTPEVNFDISISQLTLTYFANGVRFVSLVMIITVFHTFLAPLRLLAAFKLTGRASVLAVNAGQGWQPLLSVSR